MFGIDTDFSSVTSIVDRYIATIVDRSIAPARISFFTQAQQASISKLTIETPDEKQAGKRRLFDKNDDSCRNLEQLVEMVLFFVLYLVLYFCSS